MSNSSPELDERFLTVKLNDAAAVRLFCFPFAGGGTALYHRWARELSQECQLVPLALPGREGRLAEPAYRRMGPLVDRLAGYLAELVVQPYALYGHSMGAMIAFEVAREFRRRAVPPPIVLFVSASRAPHLPFDEPLHHLPDEEFVDALSGRYGAVADVVRHDRELMELFLPTMKADAELLETYICKPEEPLDCPIEAFGGQYDPVVGKEAIAAWRKQTKNDFRLQLFPGEHFFFQSGPGRHLPRILEERLQARLAHKPPEHRQVLCAKGNGVPLSVCLGRDGNPAHGVAGADSDGGTSVLPGSER